MDLHEEELRQLILSAQEGNEDSLNRFSLVIKPLVEACVVGNTEKWMRNGLGLDDLINGSCVQLVKSLKNLEFRDKRSFLNWMRRICQNHIKQGLRAYGAEKRNSARQLSIENPKPDPNASSLHLGKPLFAPDTTPTGKLRRKDRLVLARTIMERLRSSHREILQMRFLDDMTNGEIARSLGKTEGAVRTMVSRALDEFRKIRKQIDPHSNY